MYAFGASIGVRMHRRTPIAERLGARETAAYETLSQRLRSRFRSAQTPDWVGVRRLDRAGPRVNLDATPVVLHQATRRKALRDGRLRRVRKFAEPFCKVRRRWRSDGCRTLCAGNPYPTGVYAAGSPEPRSAARRQGVAHFSPFPYARVTA